MFCQNCGAKVKDDAVFCSSCGKRIGANPEVTLQATDPFTNIVKNKAENKPDDTLKESEQATNVAKSETDMVSIKNAHVIDKKSEITKETFSFVWKSYFFLIWLFFKKMEQKLVLADGHIEIYSSDIWGKMKLIKSIDYSNIERVEVIKKPNAGIVALLGAIFSTLLSWVIVAGDTHLLTRSIGFLFACVLPCYERTNRKPLSMTIYEKNEKKTKFKGEKDYFDTADLAMKRINTIISR